jgi:hypothetical protein
MSEDFRAYIKRQCVYSKLAEKPIVGQHGSVKLVFVHGYPMTLTGFYALASRAIFGNTLPMRAKIWERLNAETKVLCWGLGLRLEEGREALSVIEGIRAASDWNKESAERKINWNFDRDFLFKWVESVEQQVAQLSGVTLPGPLVQ